MIASAMVFADHPIVGVGPGMNAHHYVEYARKAGGRVKAHARRSHSLYAGLAAEHGALGLLAYLGMVVLTFRELRAARRRWQRERPELVAIADGLTLSLVVYFTTSIFLHAAYTRYFWLIMGIATGACRVQASAQGVDLVRSLVNRLARAS
jgi:O-antigen ligase